MSNLREDFGELYSQVSDLHVEEAKEKISEIISVLIDEGYSDSAINCYLDTQSNIDIIERYINISESYFIPEENVDRIANLYQEGWGGRLAKNLFKVAKKTGGGLKRFVTGAKKSGVADDAAKGFKNQKNVTQSASNAWTGGANPAGKPKMPSNDTLGKQWKDTVTGAKKTVKNNKWKTATAGVVGAGILAGGVTGGEDANKKALEKLKKDKEELDKLKNPTDTVTPTPPTTTPTPPKPSDPSKPDTETAKPAPPKAPPKVKKPNVPDGIARGITGAMDLATGNMTDFDQRGGKPVGLARIVTGIADKLTGDRTDFDKRGASKLNAGQKAERDKNYVKKSEIPKPTPKADKPKPDTGSKPGLSFADAIKLANQIKKNPPESKIAPPKPPSTNSGKVLPTPKDVRPGSAKERMISKNIEIHGADKIKSLRNKNAAFQAAKRKEGGYTMDDFVKDFPNSNTAKERRKNNRTNHPDLNKVLGRESFDAYDVVLNYLLETQQVATVEEANYVMLEMDSKTIQEIVVENLNSKA